MANLSSKETGVFSQSVDKETVTFRDQIIEFIHQWVDFRINRIIDKLEQDENISDEDLQDEYRLMIINSFQVGKQYITGGYITSEELIQFIVEGVSKTGAHTSPTFDGARNILINSGELE